MVARKPSTDGVDMDKYELVPYQKVIEFMSRYYKELYDGNADIIYAPNTSCIVISYQIKCVNPNCDIDHLVQTSVEVFEDGTAFQEKGVDIDVAIEQEKRKIEAFRKYQETVRETFGCSCKS